MLSEEVVMLRILGNMGPGDTDSSTLVSNAWATSNKRINCRLRAELVDTEDFKQNSGFRVWRIIYGSKNRVDTPRTLDNGGGEMYKPCIHSQSPHIYTITFVGGVPGGV